MNRTPVPPDEEWRIVIGTIAGFFAVGFVLFFIGKVLATLIVHWRW